MLESLRPCLKQVASYHVDERPFPIKLDANEKTFGLPEQVQAKVMDVLSKLPFERYPDINMTSLREKIAKAYGLSADQVTFGNGSSEILAALCYAFGGDNKTVAYTVPSFSMYRTYAHIAGSSVIEIPLMDDYDVDVELYIEKAQQASLAILCNPNNPTGNSLSVQAVEKIVSSLKCPVILDEAYAEFANESAVQLLKRYGHLMVVRTFSKAYGLAACRIGYLLGSVEAAEAVNKVLLPFHVNNLSLKIAEIVFDERESFKPQVESMKKQRDFLFKEMSKLPLKVYPSKTNFILFKAKEPEDLYNTLAAQGIVIRNFAKAPYLKNCLRISVGTAGENEKVLQVLRNFFAQEDLK